MHKPHIFQDVIDREDQLPELVTLLNSTRISEHLNIDPKLVKLDYIRYKPGTNCLARFKVNRPDIHYVYAKTFAISDQLKLRNAELKTSRGCHVPYEYQNGCLLYKFPTDAKLTSLSKLASENSWLCERFGLSVDPLETNILAYKPERRCVLKLANNGLPKVLKLFTKRAFDQAFAAAAFSKSLNLTTPNILMKSRRHHAILFEFIEGQTLREKIIVNQGMEGCAQAGELLSDLHRSRAGSVRQIQSNSAHHDLLTWLLPSTRNQIHAMVDEALAAIRQVQTTHVTLHGDFYDKQILLSPSGPPALLDLDDMGQGDHRIDLATFIAHLESINPTFASAYAQNFLTAYSNNSPNSLHALPAYVALATLQLAHHAFRRGDQNWSTETITSINRAQHWLNRLGEF